MMSKSLLYSVVIVLLFIARPSYAWGPLGHQTACDLAWRYSSSPIKKQLSALSKRMGYKTFATACVWADHIRSQSEYDYLKPLHYMNVPKNAKTLDTSLCIANNKEVAGRPQCVVTGISYYLSRIRQETLSQQQRDEALLLLSHFVGDIHQPLHVSYADDRGGTRRQVIFEGKRLSLHRLWDNEIVTCGLRDNRLRSWRHLGDWLYTQHPKSSAVSESSVLAWAEESYALTRELYQKLEGPRLDKAYCYTYHPQALERVRLAGQRLAQLLSTALVP